MLYGHVVLCFYSYVIEIYVVYAVYIRFVRQTAIELADRTKVLNTKRDALTD